MSDTDLKKVVCWYCDSKILSSDSTLDKGKICCHDCKIDNEDWSAWANRASKRELEE